MESLDIDPLDIDSLGINSLDINSFDINSVDIISLDVESPATDSIEKLKFKYEDIKIGKGLFRLKGSTKIFEVTTSLKNPIGLCSVRSSPAVFVERNFLNASFNDKLACLVFYR